MPAPSLNHLTAKEQMIHERICFKSRNGSPRAAFNGVEAEYTGHSDADHYHRYATHRLRYGWDSTNTLEFASLRLPNTLYLLDMVPSICSILAPPCIDSGYSHCYNQSQK